MYSYDQFRKLSGPSHPCMPWNHLQINMQVFNFRGPFVFTHVGQQGLPVPHPLRVLPLRSETRSVLILALVSVGSGVSKTADLRVVSEAFKRVLALLTAVLFQSHHGRLRKGVGFGDLVGPFLNGAKPHPNLCLGAALNWPPVAVASL